MTLIEITKKQMDARVAYLNDRIDQIREGLKDSSSVVHELYSTNSPKKDLILSWGNYLEELHVLGVFKEEISTISTYIKNELNKMGLSQATSWANDILPFKYKNTVKMTSNSTVDADLQGSTLQNGSSQFVKENKKYIKFLTDHKKLIDFIIGIMESEHFVSKLNKDELEEFLTVYYNAEDLAYQIFNKKSKDLVQAQCNLVERMAIASSTHGAGEYVSKIKDMFQFTGKQATKILKGETKRLHPLYDPKNRSEAMMVGFYGLPCPECGSWRVKKLPTDSQGQTRKVFHVNVPNEFYCKCFACKHQFTAKTEKLKIIKSTKKEAKYHK